MASGRDTPVGQSVNFTLNINTPTQIAVANPNRHYLLALNTDQANNVSISIGTTNMAAGVRKADIVLQPNAQYVEGPAGLMGFGFTSTPLSNMFANSVPTGDISAIAIAGTPVLSFIEQ